MDFSECYIGFGTEEAELNGKICYALRCSFLHCGNDDILSQKVAKNCTIDNFELRTPNGIEGGYGYAYRIKNHQNGDKEIIISGINTGTYGKDLGNITLASLIKRIF